MTIFDNNGVPIPDLSESSLQSLKASDPTVLLTGTVVQLHNPLPVGSDQPDVTTFRIGGETLDEALKTVIGVFEGYHARQPPEWVASDHDVLAKLLSDHYGANITPLPTEELTP